MAADRKSTPCKHRPWSMHVRASQRRRHSPIVRSNVLAARSSLQGHLYTYPCCYPLIAALIVVSHSSRPKECGGDTHSTDSWKSTLSHGGGHSLRSLVSAFTSFPSLPSIPLTSSPRTTRFPRWTTLALPDPDCPPPGRSTMSLPLGSSLVVDW